MEEATHRKAGLRGRRGSRSASGEVRLGFDDDHVRAGVRALAAKKAQHSIHLVKGHVAHGRSETARWAPGPAPRTSRRPRGRFLTAAAAISA